MLVTSDVSWSWIWLDSGLGHYALNMGFDEALLEAMPHVDRPVLRFYGWTEPAASFGYFQKYNDIERLTPLRPLVRRPTGGGLVPHDQDWTYSLAVPPTHQWYSVTATESYRRMHTWIRDAFAELGVRTTLAPHALKTQPGQCFAGYEENDLLCQGQKIAGAAQRRRRDGLLIQGSVQARSLALDREAWQRAMIHTSPLGQAVGWKEAGQQDAVNQRTEVLANLKYAKADYNRRR